MADKDLDDTNDNTTPSKLDPKWQPEKNETTVKGPKDKRELRPINDHDGDEYEPEDEWRGPKTPYPPSWTLYSKMSKEEAGYQQGIPFSSCGKCNFYQSGACKVVRGHISPAMRCYYFQEKYQAMVFTPMRIRIKR